MKFSPHLLFALSLITHLPSSNAIKNEIEVHQDGLLSDDSIGIQNGGDVIIIEPGPLDVILDGVKLVFEVCSKNCSAE